jgi:hypothetical protein
VRVAVVGQLDSPERDKLALIAHALRDDGHLPLIVDASLAPAGRLRIVPGALHLEAGTIRTTLTGRHRHFDGQWADIVVPDVTVHTGPGPTRSIGVDVVWPEALDNDRRFGFEALYRYGGSPAGSFGSLLTVTYKHRTVAALDGLPQPGFRVVGNDWTDPAIRRAQAELGGVVWVKTSDGTHGRGVTRIGPDADAVAAVRTAMRPTPDGMLCLMQADATRTVAGARTDVALTVLDRRVLLATVRWQSDPDAPTNSAYGGDSAAVVPAEVPAAARDLAVAALEVTGRRYGSVDLFGDPGRPVVGEVNAMPGGHAPGFLDHVVRPLVRAYGRRVSPCAHRRTP